MPEMTYGQGTLWPYCTIASLARSPGIKGAQAACGLGSLYRVSMRSVAACVPSKSHRQEPPRNPALIISTLRPTNDLRPRWAASFHVQLVSDTSGSPISWTTALESVFWQQHTITCDATALQILCKEEHIQEHIKISLPTPVNQVKTTNNSQKRSGEKPNRAMSTIYVGITCWSHQFFCKPRSCPTSQHQRLAQYATTAQLCVTCTGSLLISGKSKGRWSKCTWVPAPRVGDPDEAPDFRLAHLWPCDHLKSVSADGRSPPTAQSLTLTYK